MNNSKIEQARAYRTEMIGYQKKLICPFMSNNDNSVFCKTTECACYDDVNIECSINSICKRVNGEET